MLRLMEHKEFCGIVTIHRMEDILMVQERQQKSSNRAFIGRLFSRTRTSMREIMIFAKEAEELENVTKCPFKLF